MNAENRGCGCISAAPVVLAMLGLGLGWWLHGPWGAAIGLGVGALIIVPLAWLVLAVSRRKAE